MVHERSSERETVHSKLPNKTADPVWRVNRNDRGVQRLIAVVVGLVEAGQV